MQSRRSFLRNSALALGATQLAPLSALAADRSGYKALVCVFFYGGFDAHDMLIGYDQPSYDAWASARQSLVRRFGAIGDGSARSRESLLRLNPTNASRFGSRSFAMPPELARLHSLFDQGKLSVVPNVGPLIEPTTAADFRNRTVRLPGHIQSHDDQQSAWQASSTGNGGWGGLALDAVAQSSPYAAISSNGQSLFLSGRNTKDLQVSGSSMRRVFGSADKIYGSEELPRKLLDYYANAGQGQDSPMMRDLIRAQGKAIADTDMLATVLSSQTIGEQVRIEGNGLSTQLGTIADLIASRDALGVKRQVFFAGMGGFDTHDDQAERLPGLMRSFSEAIANFQAAMEGAGLGDSVTLFTASDFGRTLNSNATGTDHGWGSHHLVVGGAVRGGQIVGDVPPYEMGHEQDMRRGALVPEISVDQYGADLARWFGLTESELDAVFANRRNFAVNNLGLF